MIAFNFDFTEEILVDTSTDGEVHLKFNGRDLGIVPSSESNGYSITNDWNNRHFTLGFNENSVLYHVIRDDIDDRESGRGSLSYGSYIAELYGYFRTIANAIPEDEIDWKLVGVLNIEAAQSYLDEIGIIEETDRGLRTDMERKAEVTNGFAKNPSKLGQLLSNVLDPIEFSDIHSDDEVVFFRPIFGGIYIIVPYSEEYIGVTTVSEFHQSLLEGGQGSQIIDHIIRSISTE